MMSANRGSATDFDGRHVLLAFIGFFGLCSLVNGVLSTRPMSTFGGRDTDDPYRKGLDYNERIARPQQRMPSAAGTTELELRTPRRRRLRCL